jgi:hypothetical protein
MRAATIMNIVMRRVGLFFLECLARLIMRLSKQPIWGMLLIVTALFLYRYHLVGVEMVYVASGLSVAGLMFATR